MATTTINFVWTWASILSGGLHDCQNVTDPSCYGGISGVRALLRHYEREVGENQTQYSLLIPRLDYQSAFVQMHPLEWTVNRLVFDDLFGWNTYFAYPSLLSQSKADSLNSQRDLSQLQTLELRPLMSNVLVPTSNSWSPYIQNIHFDEKTGLAVLAIDSSVSNFIVDDSQYPSARALLNFVAARNQAIPGCRKNGVPNEYQVFLENEMNVTGANDAGPEPVRPPLCWIPIVVYEETNPQGFQDFITNMLSHENPPSLIVDVRGNDEQNYGKPKYRPSNVVDGGIWIVSYRFYFLLYYQQRLTVSTLPGSMGKVINVTLLNETLEVIPEYIHDEEYAANIAYMKRLADQANQNDPVVGQTEEMPIAEDELTSFRYCMGGECPIGNLFTDAAVWKVNADIAFVNSGGVRGLGWPAGDVRMSDLWNALPFANTLCNGTMTGLSLFRMLNYSTSMATFETLFTFNGDFLLQVSGMRYTYNTKLSSSGRLLGVEIFNRTSGIWEPLERLKLYHFVTDSYTCNDWDQFPSFLGSLLTIPGEVPGVIRDDLFQNTVGEYLSQLSEPYDTSIQGRLINDTSNMEFLDLLATEDSCEAFQYWSGEYLTCFDCPNSANVGFTKKRISFDRNVGVVTGESTLFYGTAEIVNKEDEFIKIEQKSSPFWLYIVSTEGFANEKKPRIDEDGNLVEQVKIAPGRQVVIKFYATAEKLDPGTALGSLSFAVYYDSGQYRGCVGKDATFEVLMEVMPPPQFYTPGSVRAGGLSLMCISVLMASGFALWVWRHRKNRAIMAMQPLFLISICAGCFILALTIIPLSIQDQIISPDKSTSEGVRNPACMAVPWLLSMGFCAVMSSLFAKLWRINKLLNEDRIRRQMVTLREALRVFVVLFGINFIILLIWTFVDPLLFQVRSISGEPWNKYGSCRSTGVASNVFVGITITMNVGILLLASYEAYKARNISSDFAESKNLGIALFSWVEIILLGLPAQFLIEADNPNAKYFIQVAIIFAFSVSMLLIIFLPLILHMRSTGGSSGHRTSQQARNQNTGMHGSQSVPESSSTPTTAAFSSTNRNSQPNYFSTKIYSSAAPEKQSEIVSNGATSEAVTESAAETLPKETEESHRTEAENAANDGTTNDDCDRAEKGQANSPDEDEDKNIDA